MSITLQPKTQQQIQEKVSAGGYRSADDVVREALRLLEERDRQRRQTLVDVRQKIAVGLAELDRGEETDGEAAFERLLSELEQDDEAA